MYYSQTVQVPAAKGRIIIKKKGGAAYVLYQYGQDYKPEKKYAIPKRAIIGKLDPDDQQLMYPNERFQDYFPDIGLPDELPEAYRSCCLRIGAYSVVKKVMDEYQLPKMLGKLFPEDSGLLLDLVSYMLINEDNAGQYYPDFAFNHPLFSERMRIYSDSKVCRFLRSVTKDQIIGFLNEWNRKRDRRQRIYLSYDSTNKNCQAGDIDIVEYGKAKDDKGLPVFNIAIAFDKTNRVPLFYEEYPGSITDVSQLECMVEKVKEFKYKDIGFILDRGYFSKANINYIEDNGYSFIFMVKGCKSLVSELVARHRNTFEADRSCSMRPYRSYGITVTSRLYEDDRRDRYFHIYFNPSKQAAERERIEQDIERMRRQLDKKIGKEFKPYGSYKEYFRCTFREGKLVSYRENTDVISKKLEGCGYYCIITSEKMTASQALIQYKGRDISEKLFGTDKSFIGSRSERVQSAESLSAKVFIEFIALIVRNRIYNLLKETLLQLSSKPNYMTVPAAIRELEKIEMVRLNDGLYKLDHAVSRRQKTILSAFGMNADDINKIAGTIRDLLATSQSLLDTDADGEKEEDDDYGAYEIDCID